MERALIWIDKLNTWVGRTFAWSIVALVFVVVGLRSPRPAAKEAAAH